MLCWFVYWFCLCCGAGDLVVWFVCCRFDMCFCSVTCLYIIGCVTLVAMFVFVV